MRRIFALSLITVLIITFTFIACKTKGQESEILETEITETEIQNGSQSDENEASGEKTLLVMMVTPEQVYKIIAEDKEHFLLDVRTPEEYNNGFIEGANLIPVQELENRLGEVPKDRQIIIYCASGVRSRSAANILMNNGFGMVYDMGGLDGWINAGYPVVLP